MATPTACTIYTTKAASSPGTNPSPPSNPADIRPETGPHGAECPGQVRPFHPTLDAGTGNPEAGGFSSFSLKLNREDGDQYLGHLNFTLPPGLTANLHGITYCPEASIAQAAKTLGRTEQADPSCPACSEIGTSNVAAGPGEHPFHAVGGSTWPDPSREPPSASWRSPLPSPAPMTTALSSFASPSTSIPSTPTSSPTQKPSPRYRRHPDPDASKSEVNITDPTS